MSIFHTRPMSNKENSLHPTSCLPSFIPKPTLSGLGRSPKKKSSSVHGTKPYARTASVHSKAKPTKTKVGKKVPPPLDLSKAIPIQRQVAKSEVRIPLSLPRVDIPPVPHLDEFFPGDVVCYFFLLVVRRLTTSHSSTFYPNSYLDYQVSESFQPNFDLTPRYPFHRMVVQVWRLVFPRSWRVRIHTIT